ncbi:Iduronate 2-Sulfatase [Manis pentadactyla]|nr:Iduronate 2-Sulfatase [Manis pentadactyla]
MAGGEVGSVVENTVRAQQMEKGAFQMLHTIKNSADPSETKAGRLALETLVGQFSRQDCLGNLTLSPQAEV